MAVHVRRKLRGAQRGLHPAIIDQRSRTSFAIVRTMTGRECTPAGATRS
jgi:hypothetical protein